MNSKDLIRGCWQLSLGHNLENQCVSSDPIYDAIDCGFTIFDAADIYLGVEQKLGDAICYGQERSKPIRVHTKFVPDRSRLADIDRTYIESIIERTRSRLGLDRIDLVQFHWWDFEIENYMQTLEILSDLKAKGKISGIGLTNVDTKTLNKLLIDFDFESIQVQTSLLDKRVLRGMSDLCCKHGIQIYAYGSLLGGFFNEKWLGKIEPSLLELKNRSLIKYKLIIDDAVGWEFFQEVLGILKDLAHKYETSIANVCISALVQSHWVSKVIVGLSPTNFYEQNRSLLKSCVLEEQDLKKICSLTSNLLGDVYELERERGSKHANIMKYDLNKD